MFNDCEHCFVLPFVIVVALVCVNREQCPQHAQELFDWCIVYLCSLHMHVTYFVYVSDDTRPVANDPLPSKYHRSSPFLGGGWGWPSTAVLLGLLWVSTADRMFTHSPVVAQESWQILALSVAVACIWRMRCSRRGHNYNHHCTFEGVLTNPPWLFHWALQHPFGSLLATNTR